MKFKSFFIILAVISTVFSTAVTNLGCNSGITGTKANSYDAKITDLDSTYELIGTAICAGGPATPSDNPASGAEPNYFSTLILKKANTILMKATDRDFITVQQKHDAPNNIEVLGQLQHIVFIKQNDAAGAFANFAIYSFVHNDYSNTLLVRTKINWAPTAGSDQLGMSFDKIIEFDDSAGKVWVIFKKATMTKIYSKSIGTDGAFQTNYQISSTNSLDVIGNHYLLYNDQTNKFLLRLPSETGYTEKTPVTDVAVGTTNILQNRKFIRMFRTAFAIQSWSNDKTQFAVGIYGVFSAATTVPLIYDRSWSSLTASPLLFTENYYNVLVVFLADFNWLYLSIQGTLASCTKDCFATQGQKSPAIAQFNAARQISFDHTYAFVLKTSSISIYSFVTTTGSTSVEKISQLSMAQNFIDAFSTTKGINIQSKIVCNCTYKKLRRFTCFATSLNCITTVSQITQNCTVPATLP